MKFTDSLMIAEHPVSLENREMIQRIAIVPPETNTSLIKFVGFSLICSVDDDFSVEIMEKRSDPPAWKDAPENA